MAEGQLEGRTALVSGGGGEIGAAICKRFASEGAKVAVADLDLAKAEAVVRDIETAGGAAIAVACDVTRIDHAQAAVSTTVRAFGKLTTLVNVAATITPSGTVETLTLEQWNATLAVNLTGAFLMCKFAVPEIRKAGGGAIVGIASSHGHIGIPKRAPYATSKAALIQFMRCLAIDCSADNIRANTISPGAIDTLRGALQRFPTREAANKAKGPSYLVGRTGRAEEIAAGALFLASDESSFMTGADLLLDGGYLAFKGALDNPA